MSLLGMFTGVSDSKGQPINIGNQIKQPTDINEDVHGSWVIYDVIAKGMIPFVKYSHSETGQPIPKGMGEMPLADFYDRKELCNTADINTLTPYDEIFVVSTQETSSE